jgi:hypothetical protein
MAFANTELPTSGPISGAVIIMLSAVVLRRCLRISLSVHGTVFLVRNAFHSYYVEQADIVATSENGAIYKWLVFEFADRKIPVLASLVVIAPTTRKQSALRKEVAKRTGGHYRW